MANIKLKENEYLDLENTEILDGSLYIDVNSTVIARNLKIIVGDLTIMMGGKLLAPNLQEIDDVRLNENVQLYLEKLIITGNIYLWGWSIFIAPNLVTAKNITIENYSWLDAKKLINIRRLTIYELAVIKSLKINVDHSDDYDLLDKYETFLSTNI